MRLQQGRYLNPKYAKRERLTRRLALAISSVVLVVCCATAIVRVDAIIRETMLPAAAPVLELTQTGWREYRLVLMGDSYNFSTASLVSLGAQLDRVLRTPPASVRLAYQLRAYLTGELPRNDRGDPRAYGDV